MTRDCVLVRNLSKCETLGNVTDICSDKTGTITSDQMAIRYIYIQNQIQEIYDASDVVP